MTPHQQAIVTEAAKNLQSWNDELDRMKDNFTLSGETRERAFIEVSREVFKVNALRDEMIQTIENHRASAARLEKEKSEVNALLRQMRMVAESYLEGKIEE